ncbi:MULTISPECIES: arginine N-succinyltransferase [unclassified Sphingomonas]|uniref:arginine N-succinyltransferase n=1 Tax=unclassified Sphingomonas TaxID=196159 RepID=UPI0006F388CE|nr:MULTISPECIES: arginine N-succinyltransferase [unclassified Sphingomonas]KQM27009.1 arginine N-succinyltransferase [Sphingomonas sp. Leaf9]KQM43343.1 arginine N-succinyltransferase [Sphingomonas sp. Leaf11]
MTFRIRAARESDLKYLYEMAKLTGGGFTNLPPDRNALMTRLERSAMAFSHEEDSPRDEVFVLVLENIDTGEVRGTCQVFTKVGQRWPFYSYRVATLTKHSEALGRTFRADILNLVNDLEGSSEVGGLFLHPGERAGGLGLLLARSRYLFIARHRGRFADRVLAELRGIIDEAGGSPFWDGVAGRFFGMTFQDADQFNAIHGNQFIADLMPRHPVYIAMLPEAARGVIGLPHPTGRAAMRMLENEGFAYENYVDIFDGGPTMTARTDQIATVRNRRELQVVAIGEGGSPSLLATGRLADFRACMGDVTLRDDGIVIDAEAARALDVTVGDMISQVAR